ncbi:MAG: hypothetical protein B7Z37_25605 [Verrucomicrobia bacterium 12-59-8]|nr:MAG: hypothetical protein B7Z37_25605 [Verrucomicrobia bacterium 12-59-8]
MLQIVAKNLAKNQLTFISDLPDISEQVQELQELHVNDDVLPAARTELNLPTPGVADTVRCFFDRKAKKLYNHQPTSAEITASGMDIVQARTVTFSSLNN